jgi:hypothetical protein
MNWAQLHKDVVFGRTDGPILWQPRIGCWYDDKEFAGEPLPAPYTGMTLNAIYRALGVSNRLYDRYNPCFRRVEHPAVKITKRELNQTDTQTAIKTPVGDQVMVSRRSPNSPRAIRLKWEVESKQELKVATWREENATWLWDQERFDQSQREAGDLGAPTMYMPRMNVQSLYIDKMGVEKGVFALYDWPDTTEAYFRALEHSHDRLIDVINASAIDIINFGENVHAGTLSPKLFEKYHLPACQRRCEKLHAAGKFVSAHWDGDCQPLLKYASETGLDGIEAITPKPQGDVTIDEIKEALGDEMLLLDGIPAIYFDEMFSVDTLVECVHKLIDMFAPKLVLGISDELSSTGDIERIRIVSDIVQEYNSQFE